MNVRPIVVSHPVPEQCSHLIPPLPPHIEQIL